MFLRVREFIIRENWGVLVFIDDGKLRRNHFGYLSLNHRGPLCTHVRYQFKDTEIFWYHLNKSKRRLRGRHFCLLYFCASTMKLWGRCFESLPVSSVDSRYSRWHTMHLFFHSLHCKSPNSPKRMSRSENTMIFSYIITLKCSLKVTFFYIRLLRSHKNNFILTSQLTAYTVLRIFCVQKQVNH